ncbi:hypothetical protein VCHC52A1_0217, partial [Vibrio cholerae HC-52A1]|jgi:hypothetical protein
MAQ